MSGTQKGIKSIAIALGLLLAVSIIGSAVSVLMFLGEAITGENFRRRDRRKNGCSSREYREYRY